eukprot:gi/632990633/ref/XP_007884257.1/ PREDICTED: retinitis pigmentosa 1-like 1 protein [Callorhinchus milii]
MGPMPERGGSQGDDTWVIVNREMPEIRAERVPKTKESVFEIDQAFDLGPFKAQFNREYQEGAIGETGAMEGTLGFASMKLTLNQTPWGDGREDQGEVPEEMWSEVGRVNGDTEEKAMIEPTKETLTGKTAREHSRTKLEIQETEEDPDSKKGGGMGDSESEIPEGNLGLAEKMVLDETEEVEPWITEGQKDVGLEMRQLNGDAEEHGTENGSEMHGGEGGVRWEVVPSRATDMEQADTEVTNGGVDYASKPRRLIGDLEEIAVGNETAEVREEPGPQDILPTRASTGTQEVEPHTQEAQLHVQEDEPHMQEAECRTKEAEPHMQEVEPQLQKVEPHIQEVESHLQEVEPHTQEVEPYLQEAEPHTQEVELHMQEGKPHMHEIEPRAEESQAHTHEVELHLQKAEPQTQEFEPHVQQDEPQSQEVELHMQDVEPQTQEVEPQMQEVEPHTQEAERHMQEVERHMQEAELQNHEAEFHMHEVEPHMQEAESHIQDVESHLQEVELHMQEVELHMQEDESHTQEAELHMQELELEMQEVVPHTHEVEPHVQEVTSETFVANKDRASPKVLCSNEVDERGNDLESEMGQLEEGKTEEHGIEKEFEIPEAAADKVQPEMVSEGIEDLLTEILTRENEDTGKEKQTLMVFSAVSEMTLRRDEECVREDGSQASEEKNLGLEVRQLGEVA